MEKVLITQENKTLSHEEDAKSLGGDAEWFRRLFIQKDSEIELLKQEIINLPEIKHYDDDLKSLKEEIRDDTLHLLQKFNTSVMIVTHDPFEAMFISNKIYILEENGTIDNPFELGKKIGNELKSQGVSEIASNWREKLEEWNKQ